MKIVLKGLLAIVLFVQLNVSFASGIKLAEYFVQSSGIVEVLTKHGVKASEAAEINSYVKASLQALDPNKNLSSKELQIIIDTLPQHPREKEIRAELADLLNRPANELKKDDIIKAINNMMYLANSHGKSVLSICSDCVSDSLSKNGIKFSIQFLKTSESLKTILAVLPDNSRDLTQYIATRMKRYKFGDYAKMPANFIYPEEEKSFALFIASIEKGSLEYKKLAKSILKLSVKDGNINLLDTQDVNKLWRVVSQDLSTKEIEKLDEVLQEVILVKGRSKMTTEDAFNQVLRSKIADNKELLEKYKNIKKRRCYFR